MRFTMFCITIPFISVLKLLEHNIPNPFLRIAAPYYYIRYCGKSTQSLRSSIFITSSSSESSLSASSTSISESSSSVISICSKYLQWRRGSGNPHFWKLLGIWKLRKAQEVWHFGRRTFSYGNSPEFWKLWRANLSKTFGFPEPRLHCKSFLEQV